jgi:hypothetical protein
VYLGNISNDCLAFSIISTTEGLGPSRPAAPNREVDRWLIPEADVRLVSQYPSQSNQSRPGPLSNELPM